MYSTQPRSNLEFRLLTRCVESDVRGSSDREIASLLAKGLEWERFLFLAAKNQVIPLVYSRLARFAVLIPTDLMSTMQRRCAAITSWNLFLACELLSLLRRFEEQGIVAVPFKGPALAVALYGDLGMRQADDLDIFIEPENLDRAVTVLQNSGYRLAAPFAEIPTDKLLRSQKDVTLENANGACVELHWAICDTAFNSRIRDFNPCSRVRGSVNLLDSVIPMTSPGHTLLMLSVHGMRHYWNRLKWVCDVAQLVRMCSDLNWDEALQNADRFSSRRTLLLPVVLANHLWGVPIPVPVAPAIQKDSALPALIERISADLAAGIDAPQWPQCRTSFSQFADLDISRKIFRVRSKDSFRERLILVSKLIGDFVRPDATDLSARPFLSKVKILFWIIQPLRLVRSCGFSFFSRTARELFAALIR